MHWSLPLPIRMEGWLNLYTIHDAIPLIHPELTPMNGKHYGRLLSRLIANADHIVTVSEQARADIRMAIGCDSNRISNCGIAVQPADPDGAALPFNLRTGRFLLFIGSDDPRKNVERLVQAYQLADCTMPLLLVGPHAGFIDEQTGIFCLPSDQSASYLSTLITQARALLLPSLAEGFGLPIVEAMALGTATLSSDRGAMAEIAGGASLSVSPDDVSKIAEGIRRLVRDDDLVARLIHLGQMRAAAFSPDNFAKRLHALYGALLPRLAETR
ncbi:MAG: glycosyltransferase family 1 protein [Sphingobium sp.]